MPATAPVFLRGPRAALRFLAQGLARSAIAAGLGLAALSFAAPAAAQDTPPAAGNASGVEVLKAFEHGPDAETAAATERTRRWVMFALGAPLLLLLLITAGLGIAMGIFGKQVYVAHMVFAGLCVTLAIVHAIVGLVWFRPF